MVKVHSDKDFIVVKAHSDKDFIVVTEHSAKDFIGMKEHSDKDFIVVISSCIGRGSLAEPAQWNVVSLW